ncbi:MAG: excinuclease ABC subunit UvrC [Candidatus Alectryocaccobium sp.]|jgi:excinuclease ABC subunit C
MSFNFNIEEELKKLPTDPGVYIMHDASDEIIYVGKAVNLKNRVRQYFQSDRNKSPKIRKMVPQIERFEYIVTDSELEALVLECNLIKENRPKYNTLLKDDKAYPFICVTTNEMFPRIFMARRIKRDHATYFGPYSNALAVKEIIELLRKLYNIRACNLKIQGDSNAERPCLYYHIHQCKAPCMGYIDKDEYDKGIRGALSFLNGNYKDILSELTDKMDLASAEMRFEEAIAYRELIKSVRHIGENQKASMGTGTDRDIIAAASKGEEAIAQIFFVRDGKLVGREHYHLKIEDNESKGDILQEFIKQFYAGTPFIPSEVMLSDSIDDETVIGKWLTEKKGSKVRIAVPLKGKKEKLVSLAEKNAKLVLEQDIERLKQEERAKEGALRELGGLLDIPFPKRIESYDISNISGFQSVGSMIVYENGIPKKADYRKFRIKSVAGPDDYASMREVLERRFRRALDKSTGFEEIPDLILMDGGKGQVNVCLKVLDELGVNITVAGMVKDDKHRTRGLYYNDTEIPIEKSSECFHLLTRIQDEVHRFAITYHRLLRSKGQVRSILDDIKGIGPARKKDLIREFENLDEIKKASLERLLELPSMDRRSAEAVYEFFNKK